MPYPVRRLEKGAITLDTKRYSIGEFATAACVSLRTLRYYDKAGLLSPSSRTPAGYRVYSESDLMALQQILALKFLGFSLEEIRRFLRRDPGDVGRILAEQQAMMRDRRRQLDTIVTALDRAQRSVEAGACNWQEIVRVIQMIQMEQQREWTKKYFTDEGLEKMKELGQVSYSEDARRKLAERPWTEADQERASAQWAHVAAESKRLGDGRGPCRRGGAGPRKAEERPAPRLHSGRPGDRSRPKALLAEPQRTSGRPAATAGGRPNRREARPGGRCCAVFGVGDGDLSRRRGDDEVMR